MEKCRPWFFLLIFFCKCFSDFIRPLRCSNSIFDVANPRESILLIRPFSDIWNFRMRSHMVYSITVQQKSRLWRRFKLHFLDTLNLMCIYRNYIESVSHIFLHYSKFTNDRRSLLQKIQHINPNILIGNHNNIFKEPSSGVI